MFPTPAVNAVIPKLSPKLERLMEVSIHTDSIIDSADR